MNDPRALPATELKQYMLALGQAARRASRVVARSTTAVRNAALEAAFGAHPPLATPAADRAGFVHDGDAATLVANALSVIAAG